VLLELPSQTLCLGGGNKPFLSGLGDCLLGEIKAATRP
jgi:hypothetical protein